MLDRSELKQLSGIQLADPALAKNPVCIGDVDMIIGAEYYEKCLCNETKQLGNLTLRLSRFDCTVAGALAPTTGNSRKFAGLAPKMLEASLMQYHRTESADNPGSGWKKEQKKDNRCLQHFESTHQRSSDVKFRLSLPFKINKVKVANNRSLAFKSLLKLEKTQNLS